MNLLRPQKPYEFCPPKYDAWFRPVLHLLSRFFLRYRFNIRQVKVTGAAELARWVREGHSVLVTPNHADHADPALLVEVGRRYGLAFHFMAARECFEQGWVRRFVLQRSGAFSVDREGADLAAIRTAMSVLRECRHPLVIFPEGEIYHHHEELDLLNEGVATILLRSSEKLPEGKRGCAVPTAIRVRHAPEMAETFGQRLDALESRITWKPKSALSPVERVYHLGSALLSVKEEEFMGRAQPGDLVERIRNLQECLVSEVERKYGLAAAKHPIPLRIKAIRHAIRQRLTAVNEPVTKGVEGELYDDLDRVFTAQQLYSYPGRYLREHPTMDRIAETIYKLEEDVLQKERYPVARTAEVVFGEPIEVTHFLKEHKVDTRSGVQPLTRLIAHEIRQLMQRMKEEERAGNA